MHKRKSAGLVVSSSPKSVSEWKMWYSHQFGSFYRLEGPASITYGGITFWNPPEWDPPQNR